MARIITTSRAPKRLLWAATFAFIAALALSAVAARAYLSAKKNVDHSLRVARTLTEWLLDVTDAEISARGYVISTRDAAREAFDAASKRAQSQYSHLIVLVSDNPQQLAHVEQAGSEARQALDSMVQQVSVAAAGQREAALQLLSSNEVRITLDAFHTSVRGVRDEELRLLSERRLSTERRAGVAMFGVVVLSLTSAVVLWYGWAFQRQREQELVALASEARGRLHSLSEVAAALAEARLRTDVAQVMVDQGVRIAGADICTLYLVNEAGTHLELLAEHGLAKELLPRVQQLPVVATAGGSPSLLDAPLFAANEREYAALFPEIAKAKATGPRAKAFWNMPLIVEGNRVGALAMGFFKRQDFDLETRTLVETLTKQCGQALYRALRLEREDEARRWFTTTLLSIGDAVLAADADGAVTFMNPVAEALTGWRQTEARDRALDEVFPIFCELTGDPEENLVRRVLREGTVVSIANQTLLRSKDGRMFPINDSGAPIRNERGELTGVVIVFRDASAEKMAHARREYLTRASETLTSTLDYETTLSAVAQLSVPSFADWCGIDLLEPDTLAPRTVAFAHSDPSKVEFVRRLTAQYPPDPAAQSGAPQVIRTGQSELYVEIPPELVDASAKNADHLRLLRSLQLRSAICVPLIGRVRTLGAITFVYAESGRLYNESDLRFAEDFARRAALAIENAIALKGAEAARAVQHALRAEAEMANRAKDEFLAIVSHELRTPLNAILGWAVMLQADERSDLKRGLSVIERNARTQAKLIDDVLDVSRVISGKLTLNMSETNLLDVLNAAIETVAPAARAKPIELSCELPSEPLWVTADPNRLQQVVWNLLANAVKFTPSGGSVRLKAERVDSEAQISVVDSGEGIRTEALPLIFDPFRQADASTTRRHGGLGLGLAIVKQLVLGHGGRVDAQSDGAGCGAKFTVRLPARTPPLATAVRARGATLTEEPELNRTLQGLRILAVDDEVDALNLVSELLASYGAHVTSASSAQEAYEKFDAAPPDLIVSDIGMPYEDGYSLLRRIRARPLDLGGGTPAVALTAYAGVKDQAQATEAGFDAHLPKPVEAAQLAGALLKLAHNAPIRNVPAS